VQEVLQVLVVEVRRSWQYQEQLLQMEPMVVVEVGAYFPPLILLQVVRCSRCCNCRILIRSYIMAKKALVSTIEPRGKDNSGYRVLEVVEPRK
jgi:hypothetical protein